MVALSQASQTITQFKSLWVTADYSRPKMQAQQKMTIPSVVAHSILVLLIASAPHPKEIVHRKAPKEVQAAGQASVDRSKV